MSKTIDKMTSPVDLPILVAGKGKLDFEAGGKDNQFAPKNIKAFLSNLNKAIAGVVTAAYHAGKGNLVDQNGTKLTLAGINRLVKEITVRLNSLNKVYTGLHRLKKKPRKASSGARERGRGFTTPIKVDGTVAQFFQEAIDLGRLGDITAAQIPTLLTADTTSQSIQTPLFSLYAHQNELWQNATANRGKVPSKANLKKLGADDLILKYFSDIFENPAFGLRSDEFQHNQWLTILAALTRRTPAKIANMANEGKRAFAQTLPVLTDEEVADLNSEEFMGALADEQSVVTQVLRAYNQEHQPEKNEIRKEKVNLKQAEKRAASQGQPGRAPRGRSVRPGSASRSPSR